MASNTTMTSLTTSETSSTPTTTTASASSTETKTVASTTIATDIFVEKTNETASFDSSRMATTESSTAVIAADATNTTGHYQPRQEDEMQQQQHQKAQPSSSSAGRTESAKASNTIRTLNELLALPTNMELCQIQLIYRAEGNANLVLALPQFKKVLRLPKSASISSADGNDNNANLAKCKDSKIQQQPHKPAEIASATTRAARENLKVDLTMKDFATYMQILQCFVGTGFVLNADICWIPQETDRKWINKHISSARPSHRLDKEFCGQFGLLLPDATQLESMPSTWPTSPSTPPAPSPSKQTTKPADILHSNLQPMEKPNKDAAPIYAIEIKPKQGWLLQPNPDTTTTTSTIETSQVNVNDLCDIRQPTTTTTTTSLISSTPTAAKVAKTAPMSTRCRYCAMQFLKLKTRKISKVSSYCPIELFSGVQARMLAALDTLFECPQNNLRVFKNGTLIYGDHANSISYEQLCSDVFKGVGLLHVKQLLVECLLRNYDDDNDDDDIGGYKAMAKIIDSQMEVAKIVVFGQPHSSMVEVEEDESKNQATKSKTVKMKTETETKASNISGEKKQETQTTLTTTTVKMEMLTPATTPATTTTTTSSSSAITTKMAGETSATMQARINVTELECLPKNCILQKILQLQLLVKHNLAFMKQAGFENYSERTYKALSTLLQKTMPCDFEDLSPAEQYLLGATALDSSVIISFQKCNTSLAGEKSAQIVSLPQAGVEFITKVTLLDLDPKPDSHFCKYIKQNKEAYAALQEC